MSYHLGDGAGRGDGSYFYLELHLCSGLQCHQEKTGSAWVRGQRAGPRSGK